MVFRALLGAGVGYALNADILVEPDAAVDAVAVVDAELFGEEVVALGVDDDGVFVETRVGVDGAELAVPDGGSVGAVIYSALRLNWCLSFRHWSLVPLKRSPVGKPIICVGGASC